MFTIVEDGDLDTFWTDLIAKLCTFISSENAVKHLVHTTSRSHGHEIASL